MEVKVITRNTRNGGEYVFTQDEQGNWVLFRHNRSYYYPSGLIRIRKFRPMSFTAQRYEPLYHRVGSPQTIHSSMVVKIIVNGESVRETTIAAGGYPASLGDN